MSDVSQGSDWWLATDGKWYPPRDAAAETQAELGATSGSGRTQRPVRKLWVWAVLLALVAAIEVAGYTLFQPKTSHSLSYRDGAVVGRKMEAYFAAGGATLCTFDSCRYQGPQIYAYESPIAKCLGAKFQLQYGLPIGDSPSEWVTGCTEGYTAATHPGLGMGVVSSGHVALALSRT